MTAKVGANKVKIARRVIAALDYIDNLDKPVTVVEVSSALGWPQSSTSELLACLVEEGILYKDPARRQFRPTQRAALLGSWNQPEGAGDSWLRQRVSWLAQESRLPVIVSGMVGVKALVYTSRRSHQADDARHLAIPRSGQSDALIGSAMGWTLLGTCDRQRRTGMIRRLIAEGGVQQFSFNELCGVVDRALEEGHIAGPAGFGVKGSCLAMPVPRQSTDHPLAIACVFPGSEHRDMPRLLGLMREAMRIDEPQVTPLPAQRLVRVA